jgi:hypothetical protein
VGGALWALWAADMNPWVLILYGVAAGLAVGALTVWLWGRAFYTAPLGDLAAYTATVPPDVWDEAWWDGVGETGPYGEGWDREWLYGGGDDPGLYDRAAYGGDGVPEEDGWDPRRERVRRILGEFTGEGPV